MIMIYGDYFCVYKYLHVREYYNKISRYAYYKMANDSIEISSSSIYIRSCIHTYYSMYSYICE